LKYHDNFQIPSKDPAASPSKSYHVAFTAKIGVKNFVVPPSIAVDRPILALKLPLSFLRSGHGFP
jgi:hypothetical protein